LILYGIVANVPIEDLFPRRSVAGFLLLGLVVDGAFAKDCRRRAATPFRAREVVAAFRQGIGSCCYRS
jgi:hypothetical protein